MPTIANVQTISFVLDVVTSYERPLPNHNHAVVDEVGRLPRQTATEFLACYNRGLKDNSHQRMVQKEIEERICCMAINFKICHHQQLTYTRTASESSGQLSNP
ncbi:unnamed protein product [Clavelina lepadiformis]|uniref:Uncharacterized protein n=1 Tax=Clavelina lepadiformis TaxID=159417 RepID=A0ABP0GBL1_CLALP